jgi:acetyl-CoA carboxylase carboxyl transferase subunit beta
MSWLSKILPDKLVIPGISKVPDGVWTCCDHCQANLYKPALKRNFMVCHKCQHHFRLPARERLCTYFLDANSSSEIAEDIIPIDHLKFKDTKPYEKRLQAASKKTGENSALLVMQGQIHGLDIIAAAFEFSFIGGSMGAAVGERFYQGIQACIQQNIPLVCFSASGGARMQEGLFALFQMSKTSAALTKLHEAKLPFISVLTDPTTGGVAASLAMLGDIIIAEPNALIGFTGPRVIEQTVREKLPEGFQRSEFLLQHGAIDMIVPRMELKDKIYNILTHLTHQPNTQPVTADAEVL